MPASGPAPWESIGARRQPATQVPRESPYAPAGPPTTTVPTVPRGPRRARLAVRRINAWSVFKFSLLFSLCMLVVWLVAVGALYAVLDSMGVFDSVNDTIRDLTAGGTDDDGIDVVFSARRILGIAALIGGVNALLFTVLATIGALLYNLCADLVGGIEVTLAERD